MPLSDLLSAAATSGLRVSLDANVARLALDRAGGNRFSHALLATFPEVLGALATLPEVRAAVLTAEGRDFSFGADLSDPAMAQQVAGGRETREALAHLGYRALTAWAEFPVPTIAAARGRIIGAGACFFCASDFAVAHPDATVQFPEVDRGMHLSWGILPRLAQRFGQAHATTLALTGDPVPCRTLPSPPVQVADDPIAAGQALARRLAAKPPLAVRAIKRVLQESAAGAYRPQTDATLFAETLASEDFAESMAAWFEKRPGKYHGR